MDVVRGWGNVPQHLKGASLAIGTFDGVHAGHRAVLDAAKAKAADGGRPMGVMMFEPYPRMYFQPKRPFFRLTSLPRKLELLEELGCGFAAVIPFDQELAQFSAQDFVRIVLAEAYVIGHASVGYNFFFGKGRGGNPGVLAQEGRKYGFGVTVIEPQGNAGEIFSSTRVRELIAEGDVEAAAEVLGYYWRISGAVESGAGRGHGLGFPTANIRLEDGITLKHGIYAVRAYAEGRKIDGAAYLGTRPTFDDGLPLLETFLFDFDGDLYGKTLDVEFIAFIREDTKFRDVAALTAQIALDVAKAKEILARAPA